MSFLSREQRYEMLCGIKRRANPNLPGGPLSIEEEQFIQDYAMEKLIGMLEDPEVKRALLRLAFR